MRVYENIFVKRFGYFNVYVIRGLDGDILIDTGFLGMKKRLKKFLDNFNIKLIILTHAHVDHVWNAAYLKKIYGCKIAMGELDLENVDNSKIKSEPLSSRFKLWTKLMNFGMRKFIAEQFDVDIMLKDNQILDLYGLRLKIIDLSGHTNGSIGILYKNYFFVGDALVNRGKIQLAFQNQDNEKALRSMQKIIDIKPKVLFFGHDREKKL